MGESVPLKKKLKKFKKIFIKILDRISIKSYNTIGQRKRGREVKERIEKILLRR